MQTRVYVSPDDIVSALLRALSNPRVWLFFIGFPFFLPPEFATGAGRELRIRIFGVRVKIFDAKSAPAVNLTVFLL